MKFTFEEWKFIQHCIECAGREFEKMMLDSTPSDKETSCYQIFKRQTVIHELIHAFSFSFGVHLVANEKTEELVCDFMGSHLDEIYTTTNKIMAACFEKGVK